jgi:hypothetical protein
MFKIKLQLQFCLVERLLIVQTCNGHSAFTIDLLEAYCCNFNKTAPEDEPYIG